MRKSLLVLLSLCLAAMASVSLSGTAQAAEPDCAPTVNYSQGANGSTVTNESYPSGCVRPFTDGTWAVPFNYTASFDSQLQGRKMVTSSGRFCLTWQATYVSNPSVLTYIIVNLKHNGSSSSIGTHTFSNVGSVQGPLCWTGVSNGSVYRFYYESKAYGLSQNGQGRASG